MKKNPGLSFFVSLRQLDSWRPWFALAVVFMLGFNTPSFAELVDITVHKSVNVSSARPGDTVVYTVAITNIGATEKSADAVEIYDLFPTGLTFSGYGAVFSDGSAAGTYNMTNWGSFQVKKEADVKGKATLVITGVVNAAAAGSVITNTAYFLSSTDTDTNGVNNTSSVAFAVCTLATNDFGLGKSVDVTNALHGDVITFTLSITNHGPHAATNITVNDKLNSAFSYVSSSGDGSYKAGSGVWSIDALGVGASASRIISARLGSSGLGKTNVNVVSFGSALQESPSFICLVDTNAANDLAQVAVVGLTNVVPDADMNTAVTNLEEISAGSLIIAMDTNHQSVIAPFNLKAYGLVNDLLWSNIPVKWAISATKTNNDTDIDFSASTVRVFPTALGTPSNRSFRSGPFIVPAAYASLASSVISNFGNSVAVFQAVSNFTADIRYTLRSKPKVGIFNLSGNAGIHEGQLADAGVRTSHYTRLTLAQVQGLSDTSCFSIITAPHDDADVVQANAIRAFLESGGNFLAQCHSTADYETLGQGHWHSTTGIVENNTALPHKYPNANSAYGQFQGGLQDNAGGSVYTWDFIANSFPKNSHFPIAQINTATSSLQKIRASMSKTRPPGQQGGLVFYLGGHTYVSESTLEGINGNRAYLNSILMPADRPTECGLAIESDVSIVKDDGVQYVHEGDVVTYSIIVSNLGPFSVFGATVADTFPPGLTNVSWTNSVFDGGNGPAVVTNTSGTGSFSHEVDLPVESYIVYTVTAGVGPSAGNIISNQASVSLPIGENDTNPSNNVDDDVDTIIYPSIVLEKTVSDIGASPGVELVSGTNGTPIVYSMIVSNSGDSALTNISINDLDLGVAITTNITLAPGGTKTFIVETNIFGDLTNTAVASAYDLSGNTLSDTNTAVVLARYNLGGSVWLDVDADGSFDGEDTNGLASVTITLCKVEGSVTSVVTSTSTGLNGGYAFTNLPAGTYIVKETDPTGYYSTTSNEVEKTLSTSSGSTETVNFLDAEIFTPVFDKQFLYATEPDGAGNFEARYLVTVENSNGSAGTYDLSDQPSFDSNISVDGVTVTGEVSASIGGSGPYGLATNKTIAAGSTHSYYLTIQAQMSLAVRTGQTNLSPCAVEGGQYVSGKGLFNETTITYGTNDTSITTNACGDSKAFLVIYKTVDYVTEPDTNGNLVAMYRITAVNAGASTGIYTVVDTPAPDTNITVNSATVTGYLNGAFSGPGPYTLASNEVIGIHQTNIYYMALDMTLSPSILAGSNTVSSCGEGGGDPVAFEGLFNSVLLRFGSNNVEISTNVCADVPAVLSVEKTFLEASEPDADGDFAVAYKVTVKNAGALAGEYVLTDTPEFDPNISVLSGTVTGQVAKSLFNPAPYNIASNMVIAAGATQSYWLVFNARLGPGILNGTTNATLCGGDGDEARDRGLFNEATVKYGTNNTTVFARDCGEVPPFLVIYKTFGSATEPDQAGDFTATYTITVQNPGGTPGSYDLSDDPDPDTNVTVNGASVSGEETGSFSGPGPYEIVTNKAIAAGATHVYTNEVSLTLQGQVLSGAVSVGACQAGSSGYDAQNGLYNEVTVTYGTNDTTVTTNACGEVPPFLVIYKTFGSATEPDQAGDFTATYTITVQNPGGTPGSYDLSDDPDPDTNVTVNGASVTGEETGSFSGPGPYEIVTNKAIAAGATHVYTNEVSLTLQGQVLSGAVSVGACQAGSSGYDAQNGLFNEVTLTYGTNDTTVTTNACGEIKPYLVVYKKFGSATEPDQSGDFSATYTITVINPGGSSGTYDLEDNPDPDTNITVNGASVTGEETGSFSGPGPYEIVTNKAIAAGATHVYTNVVSLTLQTQVLSGAVSVGACQAGSSGFDAQNGLYNEVTVTYGTNDTTISARSCGSPPAFFQVTKTFAGTSDIDGYGNVVVTYTVSVHNHGGSIGPYTLVDAPSIDTNITVNGGSVTNATNLVLVSSGPYVLATNRQLAAGGTDVYNITLSNTLSLAAMSGSAEVSDCESIDNAYVTNKGLFNAATVTFNTNGVTFTDIDCGNIPGIPRFAVVKQLVGPLGRPALLGETMEFLVTITNSGEVGLSSVTLQDIFQSSLLSFTSAVPVNSGSGAGSVDWSNLGEMLPGSSTSVTVRFVAQQVGSGTNQAVVSPVTTNGVILPSRTSSVPYEVASASISGTVRDDLDGDGDSVELDPGISNVVVTLTSNSVVVGVTTTDVNGAYAFTNLPPGDYRVTESDPSGYYSTADTGGTNDNQIAVTLPAGQAYGTNDFYDAKYASVGDFTWLDINQNGIQDPEPGYPDVRLTLYDAASNVVNVTTSSVLGAYAFTNLYPGTYFIRVKIPSGTTLSPSGQGGDPALDSDMQILLLAGTAPFVLSVGTNRTDIDAGFTESLIAARIASFEVRYVEGVRCVTWRSWPEQGIAAWQVEREKEDGTWARVGDPVPAEGDPTAGAVYAIPDGSSPELVPQRYRLGEIGLGGKVREVGVYEVTDPPSAR